MMYLPFYQLNMESVHVTRVLAFYLMNKTEALGSNVVVLTLLVHQL